MKSARTWEPPKDPLIPFVGGPWTTPRLCSPVPWNLSDCVEVEVFLILEKILTLSETQFPPLVGRVDYPRTARWV